MTDPSSQRGSGPSGSSRKDYPDHSVLGGEIGIWSRDFNSVAAPQAREAAAEIEELGYAALWFGEVLGREALTNASLLLCATSQLVVATGSPTSSSAMPGSPTPRPRRSQRPTLTGSS
jgi:hypothetical protein